MRIDCTDVTFSYGEHKILQDIDLAIPSGSLTIFCGETGSGKSTLLQVMSGLEQPSHGTITYSDPHPRQATAIVFQLPDTQIFAGTVQEDIEYGLEMRGVSKQDREPKAREALKQVGLQPDDFLARSPFLLSGGEKRRVVIAGALVAEPKLLILDEPTAGLDPAACRELVGVLQRLREQGLTLLVSTHDLDLFFPLADQVVVMREGRVQFAGEADELVANPVLMEEAGLELPAAARIAHRLQQNGMQVAIPISVDQLLQSFDAKGFVVREPVDGEQPLSATVQLRASLPESKRARREQTPDLEEDHHSPTTRDGSWDWNAPQIGHSLLERLDPRMKWLGMFIFSLVLLQISNIVGVLASITLLGGMLSLSNIPWKRVVTFMRPFVLMFGFFWLVAALQWGGGDVAVGPIGISYEGATQGGLGVLRFLLLILLGLVFTDTTTGAPLREGFEWAIRPLRKVKVPVRDLSFSVSIVLQFVPWILEKAGQLRKALASRGQDSRGLAKWSPRHLSFLIVPLVILVIKMGDELAVAIESRGYDRHVERTSWYELKWTRKDTAATAFVLLTASLLMIWG
ncbi:MAG TPA: ATP-binding cassette domain-containing protein [Bacilli bacterium]|nr:ATP-binding cassette domain-containing protein [Bacilli bacterium]